MLMPIMTQTCQMVCAEGRTVRARLVVRARCCVIVRRLVVVAAAQINRMLLVLLLVHYDWIRWIVLLHLLLTRGMLLARVMLRRRRRIHWQHRRLQLVLGRPRAVGRPSPRLVVVGGGLWLRRLLLLAHVVHAARCPQLVESYWGRMVIVWARLERARLLVALLLLLRLLVVLRKLVGGRCVLVVAVGVIAGIMVVLAGDVVVLSTAHAAVWAAVRRGFGRLLLSNHLVRLLDGRQVSATAQVLLYRSVVGERVGIIVLLVIIEVSQIGRAAIEGGSARMGHLLGHVVPVNSCSCKQLARRRLFLFVAGHNLVQLLVALVLLGRRLARDLLLRLVEAGPPPDCVRVAAASWRPVAHRQVVGHQVAIITIVIAVICAIIGISHLLLLSSAGASWLSGNGDTFAAVFAPPRPVFVIRIWVGTIRVRRGLMFDTLRGLIVAQEISVKL